MISMERVANPSLIFELATAAALAAVGFGGLVMGRLTLAREQPKPGPEPTTEVTLPEVGEQLSEMRAWMHENYPGTGCRLKGWSQAHSVTGPGDGFNLEWEMYERPSDGKWILVYEFQHPTGSGHAANPYWSDRDAWNTVKMLETKGLKEYSERQAYRGDPYIPIPRSTGVHGC